MVSLNLIAEIHKIHRVGRVCGLTISGVLESHTIPRGFEVFEKSCKLCV